MATVTERRGYYKTDKRLRLARYLKRLGRTTK